MLASSARQTCRVLTSQAVRSSWNLCLPAESSRQALLRAVTPTHNPGSSSSTRESVGQRRRASGKASAARKRFATAAAIALNGTSATEEEPETPIRSLTWGRRSRHLIRSEDDQILQSPDRPIPSNTGDDDFPSFNSSEWDEDTTTPSLPDPMPPDLSVDHPFSHIEIFRARLISQPLASLLYLCKFPSSEISQIRPLDLVDLLTHLSSNFLNDPKMLAETSWAQVRFALQRVLEMIKSFVLSSSSTDPEELAQLHICLFDTCMTLGSQSVAFKTYEHAVKLVTMNYSTVRLDAYARVLLDHGRWRISTKILSTFLTPREFITPFMLQIRMLAHLGLSEPQIALREYDQHVMLNLDPTKMSMVYRLTAHLKVGNVLEARKALAEMQEDGELDDSTKQLAIVHGYKSLGLGDKMERTILQDLQTGGLKPEAAFLNALVKIRLDSRDIDGAQELLKRFDLDYPPSLVSTEGTVTPSAETVRIAFRVYTRNADAARLKEVWDWVSSRREVRVVDDTLISFLITGMGRAHLVDEAEKMMMASLHENASQSDSLTWYIPPGVRPGIMSFNSLISVLSSAYGYEGFERSTNLLRQSGIKPDQHTLGLLIKFAKDSLSHQPASLASLLTSLLERNPHIRPSPSHLDLLLADAVQLAARTFQTSRKPLNAPYPFRPFPDPINSNQPQGGLATVDPFSRAVRRITHSLLNRGIRSTSATLATRLRFDALTLSASGEFPSTRTVWASLLARGFRPARPHFFALLRGYADAGALEQAEDTLLLARQTGIKIDGWFLLPLLESYRREGNVRKVTELCQSIKRLDPSIKLSSFAAAGMIQVFQDSGKYESAANVAKEEMIPLLDKLSEGEKMNCLIHVFRALAGDGEYVRAMEVVWEYGHEKGLSHDVRSKVRLLKHYLTKRLSWEKERSKSIPVDHGQKSDKDLDEGGREKRLEKMEESKKALKMIKDILKKDDQIRQSGKPRKKSLKSKNVRERLVKLLSRGGEGTKAWKKRQDRKVLQRYRAADRRLVKDNGVALGEGENKGETSLNSGSADEGGRDKLKVQ
ncbi:hypothetical protein TREMEDRAFT_59797 [Tremella mesenterica DSM 1558]|uniref:uncharacterized protein n=1 Tax=Tremella mesenterica (strain ATCC 24925 / CBS 8224 / DSM 1558 / NBRC 9311 / NRRL Y-6157 / RJB 2259-6 / UBC 559-6) TaxID=578456 RepID=UPI0003F49AB8|nr:uncharacterized protein TREMEDRAFT_59797 [Tremella mesenterica DSM 1558]EIW73624.1 hypothetical protein TREMEDRAFT_59797 [Tremella mesenterica DSM 1558]